MNSMKALVFLAMVVVLASVVSAHKKETTRMFGPEGLYEGRFEGGRCMCYPGGYGEAGLIGGGGPILPNKPYYGSAGYAQPAPPIGGGYGSAGGYAVGGTYGGGSGQVSGGY